VTDGRTDAQTDGQNYDSQDRASIAASRGKNQFDVHDVGRGSSVVGELKVNEVRSRRLDDQLVVVGVEAKRVVVRLGSGVPCPAKFPVYIYTQRRRDLLSIII